MRKNYDLKKIMRRAWAIRRAAAAKMACRPSEVSMSISLQMAWAEAEAPYAEANAEAVVSAWATMSGEAQANFCTRCVKRASRNYIGYSVADQYRQSVEIPAYYLYGHQLDDYTNETWCRASAALDVGKITAQNQRRAKKGLKPVTLVRIVYCAADAAIMAAEGAWKKVVQEADPIVEDEDGKAAGWIELMAADRRQDTAEAAIIRLTLQEFVEDRDDLDRQILGLLSQGYTERQIAAEVGMLSQPAVHKRIAKMRDGLKKRLA